MDLATILLIGRTSTKEDTLISALQKKYQVVTTSSGKLGLMMSAEHAPQVIILDAASMRTPGERICRQIRTSFPQIPIIHIYPPGHQENDSPADAVLAAPYSTRKLLTIIERLLKSKGDKIIECGPFSVNISRRILVAYGQETQLTPKLAQLLEVFLRNPNTVLDRKTLMETIWETDYLGDTRTLDVHIRWIRKALEVDGSQRRFLHTVRGIGYRLDIPEPDSIAKTKNRS